MKILFRFVVNCALLTAAIFSLASAFLRGSQYGSFTMERLVADVASRGDLWKQSSYVNLCRSQTERETLESCRNVGFKFDPKNCKCRYDTRFRQRNSSALLTILATAMMSDTDCQLRLGPVEVPQLPKKGNTGVRFRHPAQLTGLQCVESGENDVKQCRPKETFKRYEVVEVFENGYHLGSELVTITLPKSCHLVTNSMNCETLCSRGKGFCRVQVVEVCPQNYKWNSSICQCDCSLNNESCPINQVFDSDHCACVANEMVRFTFDLLNDDTCRKLVHCRFGKARATFLMDGSRVCACPGEISTTTTKLYRNTSPIPLFTWPIPFSLSQYQIFTSTLPNPHTFNKTTTSSTATTTSIILATTKSSEATLTTPPTTSTSTSTTETTSTFSVTTAKNLFSLEHERCLNLGGCEPGFERFYDGFTRSCICSCLRLSIYPRWICLRLMYWRDTSMMLA